MNLKVYWVFFYCHGPHLNRTEREGKREEGGKEERPIPNKEKGRFHLQNLGEHSMLLMLVLIEYNTFSSFSNHFIYLPFENSLTSLHKYSPLPLMHNLFLIKSKRVLTFKYTCK